MSSQSYATEANIKRFQNLLDTSAHSDDRDQSFQRIATSVTRVRNGAFG